MTVISTSETLLDRLANIPNELAERDQWVLWRSENRSGKPSKIPYDANTPNHNARTNDKTTWTTFAQATDVFAHALDTAGQFSGIGYVFDLNDPFTGVDFDECKTGDVIAPEVLSAIANLGGYAEVSPSLTGVKLWTRAPIEIPDGRTGFTRLGLFGCSKVEVYAHGRYFTVTGLEVTSI